MSNQSYSLKRPLDTRTAMVPIFKLVEDAAITAYYFSERLECIGNEIALVTGESYTERNDPATVKLLGERVFDDKLVEFPTLPAYELIN